MGLIETYVNIKNYHDYEIAAYRLEEKEAVEVVQALEKQIPRKPFYEAAAEKTASGRCPRCEKDVVYVLEGIRPSYKNYCRYCGQKIDWSSFFDEKSL